MVQLRCLIWAAVSSRAQTEPDKFSLPQQESDARKLAQENGWRIVDVMRVPGHSRRYIDFHELATAAANKGIDAFQRLANHWEARDFDVLVVLDGNRFARTQALHAYITEQTINIGARIFSLIDGWIDKQNHRMWIAMNGYKSAGEIDRLVDARDKAMDKRAERGLPVSSRVPISHIVQRDPRTGKSLRLEVDESKRRLWDDLATLVLEGVAWDSIESELFKRYGYVNENGEPYYPNFMYRLIMKPLFWGHIARHHNSAESKNGYKYGPWIYDESAPIPQGVLMFRNTHPPVWDGELADRIRFELERRSEVMCGRATPSYTYALSGLAVCGECGTFMVTRRAGDYRALRCPSACSKTRGPNCSNRGVLNERHIIAQLDAFLRQMLQENTTDIFRDVEPETSCLHERITALGTDIEELQEQARSLIRRQLTAPEDIQQLYDEELDKIGLQLKHMKDALSRMQGESLNQQQTTTAQQATLEELADLTLEKFWQQGSRAINQMLHRLMGNHRLVILHREVIGVAVSQRAQRRHN
ncbi:MAG TPA: recombinase family protein [Aggregatilinea sp.]|uniref:recombinase zinc beta ribbon domain-containing protein n=1 Tax=Aggregatilinea sp. TaxID=2806333 RepID=UPI002C568F9E|nr:recombinase family protein [Aggregatilinea sp.]HML22573.1 recombinase family protein [Aggregatilinea sp.]